MGDFEARAPALVESSLKYHPVKFEVLTLVLYLDHGQCVLGCLTVAVSSQSVTVEYEGILMSVGHREVSKKAEGCLTASSTDRAGRKLGLSDPVVLNGRAIAQPVSYTHLTLPTILLV